MRYVIHENILKVKLNVTKNSLSKKLVLGIEELSEKYICRLESKEILYKNPVKVLDFAQL